MSTHLTVIDDVDDERVVPFRALRERELRSTADHGGLFVAEGRTVLERLLASRFRVRSIFLHEHRVAETAHLLARLDADVPIYVADAELHERISGVYFHQGVLALGEEGAPLTPDAALARARRVVITEALFNHDNLGSLFRNVAALSGDEGALLLDPRSADPLYRKCVRVSMGWALHVPFARMDPWPDALERVRAAGFRVLAMTPSSDSAEIARGAFAHEKVALLVGSEGPGLSHEALAAADVRVRIPIDPRVDSLNVATAAALALDRLR